MELFAIIAIMAIITACGFHFGRFIICGHYKILPQKYRIFVIILILIHLLAILSILKATGFISL